MDFLALCAVVLRRRFFEILIFDVRFHRTRADAGRADRRSGAQARLPSVAHPGNERHQRRRSLGVDGGALAAHQRLQKAMTLLINRLHAFHCRYNKETLV